MTELMKLKAALDENINELNREIDQRENMLLIIQVSAIILLMWLVVS